MPTTVEIEGLGIEVEFPDSMDEAAIAHAMETEVLPGIRERTARRDALRAEQAKVEQEGVLSDIATAGVTLAEFATKGAAMLDPLAAVTRPLVAAGKALGIVAPEREAMTLMTPLLAPGQGQRIVEGVTGGEATSEVGKGLQEGVGRVVEGVLTPGNILLGGAGSVGTVAATAQKVALGTIAGEMAVTAPQTAAVMGTLLGEGKTREGTAAGVEAVVQGVLAPVLAKAALRPAAPPATVAPEAPPPLLPNLPAYGEGTAKFTETFGVGKVPGVGALFDPNVKAVTPEAKAINLYYAEAAPGGVRDAIATTVQHEIAGKIDPLFPVDPATGRFVKGTVEVVTPDTPVDPANQPFPSDFIEQIRREPDAFRVTPEQARALDLLFEVQDRAAAIKKRENIIPDEELSGDYLPRVVTERPGEQPTTGQGQRVGAKGSTQKTRLYDTEAEGFSEGTRYLPSMEGRIVEGVRQMYGAYAAKRLANHPDLPSREVSTVEAELRTAYADALESGRMTPERFEGILDSVVKKGTVDQPAFRGKVFDPDIALELREAFPNVNAGLRAGVNRLNNAFRELKFTLDQGVGAIQGQLLWFFAPDVYGRALGNSVLALGRGMRRGYSSEPINALITDYVNRPENVSAVRELAAAGSSVGRIPDLVEMRPPKTVLEKVGTPHAYPLIGPVFRAAKESFATFLDVAKVELWKAMKPAMKAGGEVELARTIETLVGAARIESIGTRPTRAFLERNLFNAPSYTRSAINMIGGLVSNNASGATFRHAISAYLLGVTATFVGSAKYLGLSDEEIKRRLNPSNGVFLTLPIPHEGKTYNVGPQGIYRSLMRLMGRVTRTVAEDPERMKHLDSANNPVTAWLRSHSAPVVSTTWDAFSGSDYMGDEVDLAALGKSALPLTLQAGSSALEKGVAFVGMGAFPQSPRETLSKERERLAQERFGKGYEALSASEQARISRELQKQPAYAQRDRATPRQRLMAEKAADDRLDRMRGSLPKDTQEWLDAQGLTLRGYASELNRGGFPMLLTPKQHDRLEEIMREEYARELGGLTGKATMQESLDKHLDRARERGRRRMLQGMGKPASP